MSATAQTAALEALAVRGLAGANVVPELVAGAVYLSPRGLRCRWWQNPNLQRGAHKASAVFLYDQPGGLPATGYEQDGFTLSRQNLRLLRRVG